MSFESLTAKKHILFEVCTFVYLQFWLQFFFLKKLQVLILVPQLKIVSKKKKKKSDTKLKKVRKQLVRHSPQISNEKKK